MGANIQVELIHNATLLIAMATIFLVFQSDIRVDKLYTKIVAGVLVGLLGIIIIISTVQISGGAIFDIRSVLLFSSGLFFGPIPTFIAALMMGIYRMFLGGTGLLAGLLGIFTTAFIGLLMRKFWLKKILSDGKKYNLEFYLAGIIVHIDVLLCMLAIPRNQISDVVGQIALPALLIYPIATFLLCTILKNHLVNSQIQFQIKEDKERYDRIIEAVNVGTWQLNCLTKELKINKRWAMMLGYSLGELVPSNYDTFKGLMSTEDVAQIDKQIDNIVAGESSRFVIAIRMKHKDGNWVWVECKGGVDSVASDNPKMIYGTNLDITGRMQDHELLQQSEKRLIRAQRIAHIGDWELDLASKKIWASEEAFEIYGIARNEPYLPFEIFKAAVDPKYRAQLDETLAKLIAKEGDYNVEFVIRDINSQEERTIRSIAFLREDDEGNPQMVIGTIQDITREKRQEKELVESEKNFRRAIEEAPIPIMIHAEGGDVLKLSRTWCELTGYQLQEIPSIMTWTQKAYGEKALEIQNEIETISALNERQYDGEYQINTKMGTVLCWDFYSAYIGKLMNGKRLTMSVAIDVTEQKERQKELEYISYHDQLTGVYNRRFYEEELSRLETTRNLPLTIVMCDVNGLKLINDSFGHAAGDQLLAIAAAAIKSCCRTDDLVARHGGDEFAIILPNTSSDEAEMIIKRIKSVIETKTVQSLKISISFGHETKTSNEQDLKELFRSAEDHMYRHKLYESGSARSKTVSLIINTLYEKNHREMLHSKRVSELCAQIAAVAGMNQDDVDQIRVAGLMHDIGKIGIDDTILNKVEKLTDSEWEEIKKHSEIGYRILSSVNEFSEIADFVLQHQEKWDGTGYPKGLKEEEISVEARIIAIADAYDAMTGTRTYRERMSKTDAIEELRRCAGSQFDPFFTNAFIEKILAQENYSRNL